MPSFGKEIQSGVGLNLADEVEVVLTQMELFHHEPYTDHGHLSLETRWFYAACVVLEHIANEFLKLTLNNLEMIVVTDENFTTNSMLLAYIFKEEALCLNISLFCTLNQNVDHMIHYAESPLWIHLLNPSYATTDLVKHLESLEEVVEDPLASDVLVPTLFQHVGVFQEAQTPVEERVFFSLVNYLTFF